MRELDGLYAEFTGRTPPALEFAGSCQLWRARWYRSVGKTNEARVAIVEARELLLRAPASSTLGISVASQ